MSSYPSSIWDGDSPNRESDLAPFKAPDAKDWARMVSEVAAVQRCLVFHAAGYDCDDLQCAGEVITKDGINVVEKGDAAAHKSIITLEDMTMVSTDGTTVGTDGTWGTQNLYTFPCGQINILSAHARFPKDKIIATTGGGIGFSDTADFEIGIGTVASAQAVGFGLGNGTQENIISALDIDLVDGSSNKNKVGNQATPVIYDGSIIGIVARLNFRTLGDDDHGSTADELTVSGVITIFWTAIGE